MHCLGRMLINMLSIVRYTCYKHAADYVEHSETLKQIKSVGGVKYLEGIFLKQCQREVSTTLGRDPYEIEAAEMCAQFKGEDIVATLLQMIDPRDRVSKEHTTAFCLQRIQTLVGFNTKCINGGTKTKQSEIRGQTCRYQTIAYTI